MPKSACSIAHQIFSKGFKSGDWEGGRANHNYFAQGTADSS